MSETRYEGHRREGSGGFLMIEETDRPQAKVEGRINTPGSKRRWSAPRVIESEVMEETGTGSGANSDVGNPFGGTSKS